MEEPLHEDHIAEMVVRHLDTTRQSLDDISLVLETLEQVGGSRHSEWLSDVHFVLDKIRDAVIRITNTPNTKIVLLFSDQWSVMALRHQRWFNKDAYDGLEFALEDIEVPSHRFCEAASSVVSYQNFVASAIAREVAFAAGFQAAVDAYAKQDDLTQEGRLDVADKASPRKGRSRSASVTDAIVNTDTKVRTARKGPRGIENVNFQSPAFRSACDYAKCLTAARSKWQILLCHVVAFGETLAWIGSQAGKITKLVNVNISHGK